MAKVYPFSAWMADGNAAEVATLPYDVMNREEAAKMAADNPKSFLRITRSEIELPENVSDYDEKVYQKAAENWQKFCKEYLKKDSVDSFYVYALTMDGRQQTGIVAAASVHDYNNNVIRKHEKTRREKEDDRTKHISTIGAQTGAVFLTYKDSTVIDEIVNNAMLETALFEFTAEDGIKHCGWRIPAEQTDKLQQAFADVELLYIADGHHRAASASRTYNLMKGTENEGEADRFLSVIFPAGQLKILPYNRIVKDLNSLTEEEFLQKLQEVCLIEDTNSPSPAKPGQVCLYLQNKWRLLTFKNTKTEKFIDSLDVSLLQNQVLDPILAIKDPRTCNRVDFIGGIRGTAELEKLVKEGKAAVAFSMYPTEVEELMTIADENEVMPPKSTWFEPKLRDGLFTHEI